MSAALATLSHEFRGAERAHAFAFWGAVVGIAMTLGPVAGGLITQTLGWTWAFYLNVPIRIAMIVLTVFAVTESRHPNATRVDIPGCLSFASALLLLTLALIGGNGAGWDSPRISAELVSSAVLFALFVAIELARSSPMLDLRFFRHATFNGANVAMLGFAATLLTMLTYLPLYFQSGLGAWPQIAGVLMLPMGVPLFLVPRLAARLLSPRFSGRALLGAGLALVSAGLFRMALVAADFSYGSMLGGMIGGGSRRGDP